MTPPPAFVVTMTRFSDGRRTSRSWSVELTVGPETASEMLDLLADRGLGSVAGVSNETNPKAGNRGQSGSGAPPRA